MNQSTRYASGTKPSNLSNAVPTADASRMDSAESQAAIQKLANTPQPAAQSEAPGGDQAEDPAVAQLMAAFADHPAVAPAGSSSADPNLPADPRAQPNLDPSDPVAQAANVVEQGLPTAVSTVGAVGGGMLGAIGGPLGIAGGAEAGNAAASAINIALAPTYKSIADKLRKSFNIPVEDSDAFHERAKMAIGEAIGLALPRIFQQGAMSAEQFAAGAARGGLAPKIEQNIATMQAAKDSGIDLGARGLTKGTEYEGPVKTAMQSNLAGYGTSAPAAIKAQDASIDAVKTAYSNLKDAIGTTVDSAGNQIIRSDNITKRRRQIGAQIGDIWEMGITSSGDKKFDAEPALDVIKDTLKAHGLEGINGKLTSKEINSLSTESRSIASKFNILMNQIELSQEADGTKKISLSQVRELTKAIGDSANFGGNNVTTVEQQLQSIYKDVSKMRDSYLQDALDGAASTASAVGDSQLSRNIKNSSEQFRNLNQRYNKLKETGAMFSKAVEDNPQMATENIIRKTQQTEYKNILESLEPKEIKALSASYVQNLTDAATSSEGELLKPQSILDSIKKDNESGRLDLLMGKDNVAELVKLSKFAMTAEKLEARGSNLDGIKDTMLNAFNNLTDASSFNFLKTILFRTPKLNDLIKDTGAYKAAFQRYNTGSFGEKLAGGAELIAGQVAGKAVPKVVQGMNNKTDNKSSSLQFRGAE